MFRGTTTRTRLALLAVTLLALKFFALTGPFAAAHTLSHAKAKATSGTVLSTQPVRHKPSTLRDGGGTQDAASTQHLRDRQRGSGHGWPADRAPISRQSAAARTPGATGAPHPHAPRSSRAHAPAALQVFRC
ncbi:hypothetical protein [Streptomyces sp. NPDC127190]|uniref:hypothetical protein n=1 Tax=unclassified Streptomyces TaxID=2593676 RepID=UPI003631401E